MATSNGGNTYLECLGAICIDSLSGGVPVASAQACGTKGNYFDGTQPIQLTNRYGARADIYTVNTTLCTSDSAASVWVMVASGDLTGWAQVGYARFASLGQSSMNYFSEYKKNASTPQVRRFYGIASGWHDYKVEYWSGVGQMFMSIDGVVKDKTNFDPAVVWSAPWYPEWEGETWYPGDNMPGIAYFGNMKTMDGSHYWYTPSPTLTLHSTGCSCYKYQWDVQNSGFHIWTQR